MTSDPLARRMRNLLRHINNVREKTEVLGLRLIESGEPDTGRRLIANGLIHDNSKFTGIEWEYLNDGPKSEMCEIAIREHVLRNPHHPEYWGARGIHDMPRVYVSEMCCDWAARASEFGTCLRDWIRDTAMSRFGFSESDPVYSEIKEFVDLLLDRNFTE